MQFCTIDHWTRKSPLNLAGDPESVRTPDPDQIHLGGGVRSTNALVCLVGLEFFLEIISGTVGLCVTELGFTVNTDELNNVIDLLSLGLTTAQSQRPHGKRNDSTDRTRPRVLLDCTTEASLSHAS